MSKFFQSSGSTRLTADGAVGTSGRPIRIFSVHEIYGSTSTGSVFRNGTSATDTIFISLKSTDSTGVTTSFGENGFLFPSGCFFDKGTSVTSILIEFREES